MTYGGDQGLGDEDRVLGIIGAWSTSVFRTGSNRLVRGVGAGSVRRSSMGGSAALERVLLVIGTGPIDAGAMKEGVSMF